MSEEVQNMKAIAQFLQTFHPAKFKIISLLICCVPFPVRSGLISEHVLLHSWWKSLEILLWELFSSCHLHSCNDSASWEALSTCSWEDPTIMHWHAQAHWGAEHGPPAWPLDQQIGAPLITKAISIAILKVTEFALSSSNDTSLT